MVPLIVCRCNKASHQKSSSIQGIPWHFLFDTKSSSLFTKKKDVLHRQLYNFTIFCVWNSRSRRNRSLGEMEEEL